MGKIKLCEAPKWDAGTHDACEFMGFVNCVAHKESIKENDEGWRVCCSSCITPYYEGELQ